eukprot:jgi/Botrbrau1/12487/Bobra.0169s0034.1
MLQRAWLACRDWQQQALAMHTSLPGWAARLLSNSQQAERPMLTPSRACIASTMTSTPSLHLPLNRGASSPLLPSVDVPAWHSQGGAPSRLDILPVPAAVPTAYRGDTSGAFPLETPRQSLTPKLQLQGPSRAPRFCEPKGGEGGWVPGDCGTRPSVALAAKRGRSQGWGQRRGGPLYLEVAADGSDVWRLQTVINLLKEGAVGIIPTDTYPALVCDVEARNAVERLYVAKGISANKPLSILCRNFSDINTYTLGFPVASSSGREDTFRIARRVLPGPYTLILHANKALPKQCVDFLTGKVKSRRTVGIRLPSDPICQAILEGLERPLLCTSVTGAGLTGEAESPVELEDAAVLMQQYAGRGIDFVVDAGIKVVEGSTVIDMTGSEPVLIRQGRGDASVFMPDLVPA